MSQQRLERIDAFVQQEVEQWSRYLLQRMEAGVRRRGIVASGEFLRSLATTAARQGLQRAAVALSFAGHGRFADMGAGNMYHKGAYQGRSREEVLKGRRGNKVYSRTAYGTLSTLMNNLANKYVDEIPELLKQSMTDGQR